MRLLHPNGTERPGWRVGRSHRAGRRCRRPQFRLCAIGCDGVRSRGRTDAVLRRLTVLRWIRRTQCRISPAYSPRLDSATERSTSSGRTPGRSGGAPSSRSTPYLESTGIGARIRELLSAAGLTVVTWSDIQPNPSCFGVDDAAAIARESGSDLVVAAGGGSATAFPKSIALTSYYFDIEYHPHPVSRDDITRIYRRCL